MEKVAVKKQIQNSVKAAEYSRQEGEEEEEGTQVEDVMEKQMEQTR